MDTSCYPQIGNLDENTRFQTGINNVVFSLIMIWMTEIWTTSVSVAGSNKNLGGKAMNKGDLVSAVTKVVGKKTAAEEAVNC
ncbi:MAG: hypothetical protein KJ936_07345, partial [Proteobacteria bacterium]|nr:hypothetical protein [Pseudomonadota bacterium]